MQSEYEKLSALGDLNWIKSFWAFDNHVVAKLHGFADVYDYYHQNSSIHYLKDIKTKTLLIHALDDPMMTPTVLPKRDELSASTRLMATKQGGHVGFIRSMGQGDKIFWLEEVISSYI